VKKISLKISPADLAELADLAQIYF